MAGLPAGASPASAAQGRKTDRTPLPFGRLGDQPPAAQRVAEATKQVLDGLDVANGLDGSRGADGLHGGAGADGSNASLPAGAVKLLATRGLAVGVYDPTAGVVVWSNAGVTTAVAATNTSGQVLMAPVSVLFAYAAGSTTEAYVLTVLG